MSLVAAVLDANVLFPQELRDTLIRASQKGLYSMRWTAVILEEMRRNLVATGHSTPEKSDRFVQIMRNLRGALIEQEYQSLIPLMQNDPKDRHVLAAAVACRANVIVTSNLKDFPKAALDTYELIAQSPDTFLNSLFDDEPDLLEQVIVEQSADTQSPPLTTEDILQRVGRQAPQFAQRVRIKLHQ